MTELPSALALLSAMLTPALLVLASASLISSTTARLISTVNRTRETSLEFAESNRIDPRRMLHDEERNLMVRQIARTTRRARILQRALVDLHVSAGLFVATSISIGILEVGGQETAWPPVLLGLLGTGILLFALILLMVDGQIGRSAINDEMDFILRATVLPKP